MPTKFEVTKAVRRSDLPAPARLVMFVLADVAETGTAEIPEQFTPSLKVLAHETGLNESTVKRYLNTLEADGWLERRRPTIDDARLKGERTRYRLLIPGPSVSPAHGAEEAHEGAERAQEGAQEAQGRAQEEPRAGRSQRPNKEDLNQDNQDQPRTAPPEPFDEAADTAQTIVGAWIDYCSSRNVKLPKQLIGHYAKNIKLALDDGFSPNHIKAALASMLADATANRPSVLPHRLVEIQTGPERRTNGHKPSTSDTRVAEGLALADRLEQKELSQ